MNMSQPVYMSRDFTCLKNEKFTAFKFISLFVQVPLLDLH